MDETDELAINDMEPTQEDRMVAQDTSQYLLDKPDLAGGLAKLSVREPEVRYIDLARTTTDLAYEAGVKEPLNEDFIYYQATYTLGALTQQGYQCGYTNWGITFETYDVFPNKLAARMAIKRMLCAYLLIRAHEYEHTTSYKNPYLTDFIASDEHLQHISRAYHIPEYLQAQVPKPEPQNSVKRDIDFYEKRAQQAQSDELNQDDYDICKHSYTLEFVLMKFCGAEGPFPNMEKLRSDWGGQASEVLTGGSVERADEDVEMT